MNLDSKVFVVTGGFGALGRVVGSELAEQGARVVLLDFAKPPSMPIPGIVQAMGGVDLSDAAAAKRAIDSIAAQHGQLDALVNIAGVFQWETLGEGAIETWDRMYQMNVRTAVCCCKAATPHLTAAGQGRIVNIGAAAAQKAALGMGAYAASKAGVARLTEALAEELKDQGVTVNAILPSILDTPANRAAMPEADATRWVQPSSIASLVSFLLSAQAAQITGALIPITGRV